MAGLSRARLSSPAAPIITESPTAVIGPAGAGTSAGAGVEAASVVASVVSGLADEASVWIDSTEREEGGAGGWACATDRPTATQNAVPVPRAPAHLVLSCQRRLPRALRKALHACPSAPLRTGVST